MKNFKLGTAYGSIIKGEYEVKGWKEVKHFVQDLHDAEKEKVVVCFVNRQEFPMERKSIYLECGNKCIGIRLSCDADFITDLLTTDIVKTDIKKVVVKKRKATESVFEDPYKVDYIVKNDENHICAYSFHTDKRILFERFMERVSVKALPIGRIDAPTNKKLVKLNRKALKQINYF